MKDVQCYELFGGIALKNDTFSFSWKTLFINICRVLKTNLPLNKYYSLIVHALICLVVADRFLFTMTKTESAFFSTANMVNELWNYFGLVQKIPDMNKELHKNSNTYDHIISNKNYFFLSYDFLFSLSICLIKLHKAVVLPVVRYEKIIFMYDFIIIIIYNYLLLLLLLLFIIIINIIIMIII